jgi:ribokinase
VTERTARILVVGSANVDYAIAAERLPGPGETVSGGTLAISHGGKGANQAVAARRLGAEVQFIGCVGADPAGTAIRAQLTAEGIGVAGLFTTTLAATGTALIAVDIAGRNQIAVAPGANHCLSVEMLSTRIGDFAWPQVVLCQFETPMETVRWTLREARAAGAITVLNPAPIRPVPDDVWPLVDYLTPNQGEAQRLTGGIADPPTAARVLLDRGVQTVIVTLGEGGALACTASTVLHVPAPRVRVVDTTGAGDAFNGALAVACAEGRTLAGAVSLANACGALACTRRGAQGALPRRGEAEALFGGAAT